MYLCTQHLIYIISLYDEWVCITVQWYNAGTLIYYYDIVESGEILAFVLKVVTDFLLSHNHCEISS